ncbi:hypothetical protein ACLHDF_18525 [Priestia aryabhattai]|uniref:hypothetical protein n=1 Tax=Priestia megaterium TaxID=1404 RepID=UPI0039B862FB
MTAEETFKRISYYNTLNGALNALIEKEIKDSDAISLEELKKHIAGVKEDIF